jgi:transposase, IS5 family
MAGDVPPSSAIGVNLFKSTEPLLTLMTGAERIRTQQPTDKNKLYALHAPEVECIGKGKARKPYEFGVKTSIALTHKSGPIVGARTFPGNPYDGHILNQQLEQTKILLEDTGKAPKQVFVDLGYRGVDKDNPGIEIIHRGKSKSLTPAQRRLLKRRQAVEPVIGHLKSDHRMQRRWLQGQLGGALHTVLCTAGYNLRWLLRAMVRLGLSALEALLLRLIFLPLLRDRGLIDALKRTLPPLDARPASFLVRVG